MSGHCTSLRLQSLSHRLHCRQELQSWGLQRREALLVLGGCSVMGGGVLSSVLMVTFLRFSPFVVSKPFHCIIFIGLSLTIVSNPSLRVFFKIYLHT